jgi:2-polyprenyl-3-methyl-5-hydroxy-6-metoxy-1,4-benzoquinol methylase
VADLSDRGDRSAAWRSSYLRVQKDPLRGPRSTNRRRLQALGVQQCAIDGRWIDVGAGDGNLVRTLDELGISDVVAIEYQTELLSLAPPGGRVAGSAVALPVRGGSADVVIFMDVLHHLDPGDLAPALGEASRVLRAGGALFVCEPAATLARRVLTVALMSPLAGLTQFSRDKRTMVLEEEPTLVPWLAAERGFVAAAALAGFRLERRRARPLHSLMRFTAVNG